MSLAVSAVICTHNRPDHLRKSVQAVLAQTRPPAELIIVKDAPGDIDENLASQADKAGVAFTAINTDRPSLPASRNCGMALADGDIVMLLDDDMILPTDFFVRLIELYEADAGEVVGGIGAVAVPSAPARRGERLWDALARALGQGRWVPRRWRAQQIRLPASLRDRLTPARRLTGGAISLRRTVAKSERFDDSLSGYALGEDREFCYRVGARWGLFLCPSLQLTHDSAPAGRPDARAMAKMYVANSLHIASRGVGGGAGTYLVMACEMAGVFVLHAAWLPLGDSRTHWGFLVGMIEGLLGQFWAGMRRRLCGC